MTAGGKTGSVVIQVDNRRGATAITSLTPSAAEVYFEHNATLTAVLEPADSWGNLEWTSDNEDVAVTVDPTDEKKATVSVAQGAKSGTVTITATAQGNKALTKEVTLTVHSVIPSKINITCSDSSDSMYVDEELTFTAKVFNEKGNEDSKLKQEIEWKAEPGYFFSITQDGKLTCKNTSILKGYDAQEVTVCAYSTADNTIYAKKEITVYKRPASITTVSCKDEDNNPQTACLTIENSLSAPFFQPRVRVYITTSGSSDSTTSDQFVISEKTEFTGKPTSDYLKTALYKTGGFYAPYCTLEPKKHTGYQPKTFYVYPFDPKTGTAITSGSNKSFSLTIYQYPKFDSISLDTKDCVVGVSEDPMLTIKLKDTNNFGISKKISVTTKAYVKKHDYEEKYDADILETTEYELATNKASNHFTLKFKPRNEWEEKIKKAHKIEVHIRLLDPHRNDTLLPSSIPSENFQHSINIHDLDIKIEKGNFKIHEAGGTPSTYYGSEQLYYKSTKLFHFYVKVLPEWIDSKLLEYDIKRITGDHTCIINHKKSDEQDKPGWIKYEFNVNRNNTWGSNDEADFVFKVKGVEIPRVLRIDSN